MLDNVETQAIHKVGHTFVQKWVSSENKRMKSIASKMPYLKFKDDWDVCIMPPYDGAAIIFAVRKGNREVRVYLRMEERCKPGLCNPLMCDCFESPKHTGWEVCLVEEGSRLCSSTYRRFAIEETKKLLQYIDSLLTSAKLEVLIEKYGREGGDRENN